MTDYSIDDPAIRLADLVERARKGETVVLTQNGQPVAEMRPAPQPELTPHGPPWATPEEEVAWLRANRVQRPSSGISSVDLIRQMRDEGPGARISTPA